jgi:transcriptional regulator with XRE-family HTH domain
MASIKVKRRREKSRSDYRQPLENGPSVRFVDREERERVGARVRAARRMANMERREDLTDLVNLPRFSAALLGQIERGERVLHEHEAEALARVLPVDAGFFYETPEGRADESTPPDLGEHIARIFEELQALRAREQDMQTLIDRQNANLAAQTRILERMQTALGITAPAEDAPRPPVRIPGATKPTVAGPERSSGTRRRGGSQGA